MQIWHLGFSTDTRHPLFAGEQQRRRAVRSLCRVAGRNMALFSLADDHGHVVLVADAERKARLSRSILISLRSCADTDVLPAHVKPVTTRSC